MPKEFQIEWKGLVALQKQLRALPDHLCAEAQAIVESHAHAAANAIIAAYPTVTGNLKRGVRVETTDMGRYGVGVRLRNVAKHAYIYEVGTQGRHRFRRGKDVGPMPAGHVFLPIVIRQRRRMYGALEAMLKAEGFRTMGHAA